MYFNITYAVLLVLQVLFPVTNLIPYLCTAPAFFLWYSHSYITKHVFNTIAALAYQLCFFFAVFYMFYYNQNSGKYPAKPEYSYGPVLLESLAAIGVVYELILSTHEEYDIIEVRNHFIKKEHGSKNERESAPLDLENSADISNIDQFLSSALKEDESN